MPRQQLAVLIATATFSGVFFPSAYANNQTEASSCKDGLGQPIGCPASGSGGGGTQPTAELDRVVIEGQSFSPATITSILNFRDWYYQLWLDSRLPRIERDPGRTAETLGAAENKAADNSAVGKVGCAESDSDSGPATTLKPVIIATGEKILPQQDFAIGGAANFSVSRTYRATPLTASYAPSTGTSRLIKQVDWDRFR